MNANNETLQQFTEALSSTAPAPGGGGAAALMQALSVSLGAMAAGLSAKRGDTEALTALAESCRRLRLQSLALIDADAEAFLPLSAAYKLPKDAPERAETLRRASLDACAAAASLLLLCGETAELLTKLRELVSPLLLSDVGCAAAACRAALLCAAMNVYVNTKAYAEDPEAQRLDRFAGESLQSALPKLEEIELQVMLRLRDEKHG